MELLGVEDDQTWRLFEEEQVSHDKDLLLGDEPLQGAEDLKNKTRTAQARSARSDKAKIAALGAPTRDARSATSIHDHAQLPATTAPCPFLPAAGLPPSSSASAANSAAQVARQWPRPSSPVGWKAITSIVAKPRPTPRHCQCNWWTNWRCTTAPMYKNRLYATTAISPKRSC